MKASEQYFIAALLKISYIGCGSKDGIIVIILTDFITSKHAIACSWRADSRERGGVKGWGRLEQANYALITDYMACANSEVDLSNVIRYLWAFLTTFFQTCCDINIGYLVMSLP